MGLQSGYILFLEELLLRRYCGAQRGLAERSSRGGIFGEIIRGEEYTLFSNVSPSPCKQDAISRWRNRTQSQNGEKNGETFWTDNGIILNDCP